MTPANESLADRIRMFARMHFVDPARESGRSEFSIRAGDVHRDMGLANRMPAVCSALRSRQFAADAGVELRGATGPRQGANAVFIFALRTDSPATSGASPIHESTTLETPEARPAEHSISVRDHRPGMPVSEQTVFLVSCVSKKRSTPAPACDLYISDLFRKERAFIEATGCRWFILSAEHGLVAPEEVIVPYDRTLNTMGIAGRRAWARRVWIQLSERVLPVDHIVIFAGHRYREFLLDPLRQEVACVEIPLEGLRIGEQLSWFARKGL